MSETFDYHFLKKLTVFCRLIDKKLRLNDYLKFP